MSWIDIGIIALVVLLGLFGVWKGLKKSLLSTGAFLIAFLLAFFLANVVAEALIGIEGIKGFVLGDGFDEKSSFSLANWIYHSLQKEGTSISPYIMKHFYNPIIEIIAKAKVDISPDQGLAVYLAFLMFSAICGVGIFIIVRFLLVIVTVIVKSYIGKAKTPLTRLFGFIVGAMRGAMWAFAITLVFTCFGGLTFMPAFGAVEKEYEHKNGVVCESFNNGAYYIRNNLFLPDSDMYGRIVERMGKKDPKPNEDLEKLTGGRLELFINLSNLNYENSPWTIDQATKKRKFDENDATPINASEFAKVGFENVVKAILEYNKAAAEFVDNLENLKDLSEANFVAYNGIIQSNTTSVYNNMNSLMTNLRAYIVDFEYGQTLTGQTEIDNWNNTTLSDDYNKIKLTLQAIAEQYGAIQEFAEFPDLTDLIPDRVNAGPQQEEGPSGDGDRETLTGSRLKLFISLSNLNYENSPWSIDVETGKRRFAEENAQAINASAFAAVGFDEALQAILDYNEAAAEFVDDLDNLTELEDTNFGTYNDTVVSINGKLTTLISQLRTYLTNFESGTTLTEEQQEEIESLNSTLAQNYAAIQETLQALKAQYATLDGFDDFPVLDELIPECATAGAQEEEYGVENASENLLAQIAVIEKYRAAL
ncbi:MAG: CvpA family protein [Clostridiales bacterium]|nr:CvpA family protein [Clostridiales bacterium]